MEGDALNQSDEEYTIVFMGALSNLNIAGSAMVNPRNKPIFKNNLINKN
mgnify:FL=1